MVLINLVSAQGYACQLNKHAKENIFYLLVAFLGSLRGDAGLLMPEQNRSSLLKYPFLSHNSHIANKSHT